MLPRHLTNPLPPPDSTAAGTKGPTIAIVHDYLTQRGGAERVVLSLLQAFPGAELYTSLYEASHTYPAFQPATIRTSALNRWRLLRYKHRLAFPLLPIIFSEMMIRADVCICSSSGWAHGAQTTGRKIVYCYTPARWLYHPDQYVDKRGATLLPRAALSLARPSLVRWDQRAATTAHRFLVTSSEIRNRVRTHYARDAEVLPPPPSLHLQHPRQEVPAIDAGYWLCVARLMPYKNIHPIIAAFNNLRRERLVIVGTGPQERFLRAQAGPNILMIPSVTDAELCWLYSHCQGLVAASYEDYGLTPLEAAVFGKPSVVLKWGGYLDTVHEGINGTFFSTPQPHAIRHAIRLAIATAWQPNTIMAHARNFDEAHFHRRLQEIVAEEAATHSAKADFAK